MIKNVLITGTGGRSIGSGILHSLLRANKEVAARWNLIAADADPFAWGLYKTEQNALLPLANSPEYLPVLKDVINRFGIHAIVPGTEPETAFLSKHKEELGNVSVICNNADLMPLMMNKEEMVNSFKERRIKYIETFSLKDSATAINQYGFPLILKPLVGTGGSRGLQIISSEEELAQSVKQLDNPEVYCLQPYIGDSDNEFTVGVISDKEGNVIDSIVMKRKLIGLSLLSSKKIGDSSFDISTGYSQGFIIKHPEIQEFCEDLAKTYDSRGPLNIQLRIHNGDYYVFDFHPRFSGTTPMRADVGFNEVDLLLRNHLFGEQFSRLDYQYDVAAIRAFEHVIVPISEMTGK